ncbi:MAG TPA: glycosyl hydrolase family 8 [Prolixibacteraceae bacterium]|nr:glycosyl hydrolase family 8 [Prolixibacteraceae bacterium]HPS12668.1 glycosyl hydrolase family 8 [Prolixibacteraceae bacterium]
MKKIFLFVAIAAGLVACGNPSSKTVKKGSFASKKYPNLFTQLLGKSQAEVDQKVNDAWKQLFYGNDSTERIYYPVGDDMGYILDVNNNDVRSEGISYGMMIALQLDKKKEFDCIWKWAKTYMQHQEGQRKGFFAWHATADGKILDDNSASDGEEWMVTSLLLASRRWGNGEGIYNYQAEAQAILDAMLSKTGSSESTQVVTNMFNKEKKQIVFVPVGNADDFTDPSYHVPHFYELWALWADKDNQFWSDAADSSRAFLKRSTHPVTGLNPDYANFDGTPTDPFGGGQSNSLYDSWRVVMNVAVDYVWFEKDQRAIEHANHLLNFFYLQGMGHYGSLYNLDGTSLNHDHNPGLVAMNAAGCLASTFDKRKEFVEEFWNLPLPTGHYRYYDGVLYMLGLLEVSGNFRIYGN